MSQTQALPASPTDPASRPLPSTKLDATYRRIAYRLVPFSVVLFILVRVNRVSVDLAKLSILQDLQFSEAAYDLGADIFFIGCFLFEVPSNLLLERISAHKTLARIAILQGLTSVAMICVKTSTSFYVMRFLLGIFKTGFFPGVVLYLTYWSPPAHRARINGLFMTLFTIAGVVGDPVAGFVMSRMEGMSHLINWQWLFLLEGIPFMLANFVVPAWLPETPRQTKRLSAAGQDAVVRAVEAENRNPTKHASSGTTLANARAWIYTTIYFHVVSDNVTIAFWTPSIIKGLGVQGNSQIGLIATIPFIVGTIVMVWNGAHSDRMGERRMHCAIAAAIAVAGLVATGVLLGSPALTLISLTVAAIGILAAFPVFWSIPAVFLTGTAAAGDTALISSIGNLTGFVAPYIIGWLKTSTGHLSAGLYFVVALELGATVLVILGTRKH